MRVAVVVCTHSTDRLPYLREAVESVLRGSHDDVDVIVVSDGDAAVAEQATATFATDGRLAVEEGLPVSRVRVVLPWDGENRGLAAARNAGAEATDDDVDVVAFLDDDAVADEEWVARLVAAYEEHDVPAAGGQMTPLWVAGEPGHLPAEFYFLVGVTHRGFADGPGEVRNTFGSNISFRRDIFFDLGGFNTDIGGRKGDKHLQGEETELCARLRTEYGHGVWYDPEARVAHKVFDYRTDPGWLVRRAFWQGYSKRGMEVFVPASTGEEGAFLGNLLTEFVPDRLRGLVREPSSDALAQLVFLFVLTASVGLGYLYGWTKWR